MPTILSWKFEYGLATPCDSFWLKCLWAGDDLSPLSKAIRFYADEDETRVFTGVVDEFELYEGADGRWLEISGRGMAALLIDNEAEAADYGTATWEDIVSRHVEPYGIEVIGEPLPAVAGFSVPYGSSEWQAMYNFARYHGGITPRFDRLGRLVVSSWGNEEVKVIDDLAAVTGTQYQYKRYGVLSSVKVRDKTRQAVETVENTAFLDKGGRCRRWYTMPARSSYQAMRYQGEYQLNRSMAELEQLVLSLATPLYAAPGDLVRISRSKRGWSGLWRVAQTATGSDEDGGYTVLTLGRPNLVG